MSLIQISGLSFAYDEARDYLFKNVSLDLETDWKLGFIGRNGCGKTTFLQLLMKHFEYSGRISTPVEFDYFPFPVPDSELTAPEILPAVRSFDLEVWRLARELALMGVPEEVLDRPFKTLSGGERTKVMLASLFLRDERFLLIDEPTNHLDIASRERVGRYLQNKKGFILVSHDRHFLDQCIDHVLSLDQAGLEVRKGDFSAWRREQKRLEAFERSRHDQLKKDIKKMSESARRAADWSARGEKLKMGHGPVDRGFIGHKAAKMMKRSKALERRSDQALEEKKGLLRKLETGGEGLIIQTLKHHKQNLLLMKGVDLNFGRRTVLRDFNLSLSQGERVALTGNNGCGKSSLLKLVTGELRAAAGEIGLASGLKIACVPQETSFLKGSLRNYISSQGLDESLFKCILHHLGFEKKQFDGDLADYSQGQKKKVLIAAGLAAPVHLHLWDEPLNAVDLVSRMQLEKLLIKFKPTMLLVEHDQAFIDNVATSVVRM